VFGDEAKVLGVEGVEAAEGDVFEAVEVVVARRRRQLPEKKEIGFFPCPGNTN